jgi:alpha-beta hydrolase superfamily lysophospholipase
MLPLKDHELPHEDCRWLTTADGIRLFVRHFQPAGPNANRTLLWCHGVGDHGGRHGHVVAELLSRGWRVIIPDLRGHGRSEGIRCDVASFEDYLCDFDQLAQEFRVEPHRTALFGHSFGGLVLARWVQTRTLSWAALVMSAPLLGIALPIPAWKWWAGRFLLRWAPRTHLKTGIREENLTSDPEFLAARRADPLIQHSVTVRWFYGMLSSLQQAHADAASLTLPILILQGTADETTDPHAPAKWLQKTRSVNARIATYPGGLHELLNDRSWRAVCAELLDWLDERLPSEALP